MEIVDEELSNTRAEVNTTLTLFRQLVNNEVRRVENAELAAHPGAAFPDSWNDQTGPNGRRAHILRSRCPSAASITLDAAPNLDSSGQSCRIPAVRPRLAKR